MKYLKFFTANLIFIVVLIAIYLVHVIYFKVNVVFYSALADAFIASMLTLTVISLMSWFNIFSKFEKLLLTLIWILLGYAVAISVPTVIDRSLSFYTLEKIQQRGGGIQLAAFERVYVQEYMKEHRLVDVRLTEQEQSGTVQIKNGCVKLTPWGNTLATFSKYFRNHFLPKQRLLMGQYSNDLTDPFRNENKTGAVDYLCK
ncbi:hypothetical protein G3I67_09685 [Orrella sp. NBD-18]|uniref:Uncharacterized protein n=1 Tax=Sheuella amnicola TaxID=2707330 RepID=A0A6B2QZQ2_9BURK|nr:hypothetical protein [Sheuella amnicola]NDY83502.1 hypothetical protein [Sheuella amnicola]